MPVENAFQVLSLIMRERIKMRFALIGPKQKNIILKTQAQSETSSSQHSCMSFSCHNFLLHIKLPAVLRIEYFSRIIFIVENIEFFFVHGRNLCADCSGINSKRVMWISNHRQTVKHIIIKLNRLNSLFPLLRCRRTWGLWITRGASHRGYAIGITVILKREFKQYYMFCWAAPWKQLYINLISWSVQKTRHLCTAMFGYP